MPRILIVDDDKAVRTAIQVLLEHEGFEVVVVENGRSAIEAFLYGGVADLPETPVFGCSLRDPESPREGWTASWHK